MNKNTGGKFRITRLENDPDILDVEVDARTLPGKSITHAYSGVIIKSDAGEEFGICNRDSGFEFCYCDIWYEAKEGRLQIRGSEGGGE